ncbi:MAG: V-type ATPase subunit [Candidatus Thermoplasmatota archaeon]|nr:V-type ATPase subunit [Candidatus Thermoplasmatota archaeon]MDP7265719.1 V-type ATPase subunit [Candidatus Thermoplasmatota archaeon]
MDLSTWPVLIIIIAVFGAMLLYLGMKVPMVWTIARFGYSNALYNSRINRFVRRMYVNNLMGTNSFGEAVNFISSASSKDFPLKTVTNVEEAEEVLLSAMLNNVQKAKEESPDMIGPVLDSFIIRYENRTLKNLFSARFHESSTESGTYPVGVLTEKLIDEMKKAETLVDMINLLPRRELREMLSRTENTTFRKVENLLDGFYIESVERSSSKLPRTLRKELREFLEVYSDMLTIKTVLRMIKAGVPAAQRKEYSFARGKHITRDTLEAFQDAENVAEALDALGRTPYAPLLREVFKDFKDTGRISLFELELDRFWIRYIEIFAMKMNTTVGPVIRYLTELEFETRNVIAVLRGFEVPGGKELAEELLIVRGST